MNIYDSLTSLNKKELVGKTVCMAFDGWSNVHNESIICICVTNIDDGLVYLLDTIDTKDNSHSWDYLVNLVESSIKFCETFGCTVGSVVTDNAANMNKMRKNLATCEGLKNKHIITLRCSAHLLNLLAHDIEVPGVKSHIKIIFKYFKNSHFFGARYKLEGGKALVFPQDVRWNTLADTIQCFLNNWHILYKVCNDNRAAIDETIFVKVKDLHIKSMAQEYLVNLKKVALSLDLIQSDSCTISEATHIWLDLKLFFEFEAHNSSMTESFNYRFDMAITEYHLLAYILDPRYFGTKLTDDQLDSTLNFVNMYHHEIMTEIIKFQARSFPFKEYLFSESAVKNIKPLTWWLALKNTISHEMLEVVTKLFTAVASSAGIERIFSTYGLVHSKIRNMLEVEKSSKLGAIFKSLNKHCDN